MTINKFGLVCISIGLGINLTSWYLGSNATWGLVFAANGVGLYGFGKLVYLEKKVTLIIEKEYQNRQKGRIMWAYKCDCCGKLKKGEAKYSLCAKNDIDTLYDLCEECFKPIEYVIKSLQMDRDE